MCTEDVNLSNLSNLNFGAWWGTTATLHGHLAVNNSQGVYLYGLNVTNPNADGIDISSSRSINLDTITSNGSAGIGLSMAQTSDVNVTGPSAFDRNGNYRIQVSGNSMLTFGTWNGLPIEINNNKNVGLWVGQASFATYGSTTVVGNASPFAGTFAFGVMQFGGSRVQMGTCTGPIMITQNQSGGISVEEDSEISLWNCDAGFRSEVQNNGPVAISVGLGSQITIYDDVAARAFVWTETPRL